jgi:hypothetical protein
MFISNFGTFGCGKPGIFGNLLCLKKEKRFVSLLTFSISNLNLFVSILCLGLGSGSILLVPFTSGFGGLGCGLGSV